MGGGHVSRPDFGMPQPDPAYPLTEFYLLLQHALDKAGRFALPALYARVQAPARHIYLDEAREYLSLSPTGREGDIRLLAEGSLRQVSQMSEGTMPSWGASTSIWPFKSFFLLGFTSRP